MCIRDRANGVPIPADLDSPYSVDQNLWGRANECGVLENPWNEAPEDAYEDVYKRQSLVWCQAVLY